MDVPRNEHHRRHLHEVSNRRLIHSSFLIFYPNSKQLNRDHYLVKESDSEAGCLHWRARQN